MPERVATITGVRDPVPLVLAQRYRRDEEDDEEGFHVEGDTFGGSYLSAIRRIACFENIRAESMLLETERGRSAVLLAQTLDTMKELSNRPVTRPLVERWLSALHAPIATQTTVPQALQFFQNTPYPPQEVPDIIRVDFEVTNLVDSIGKGEMAPELLYPLLAASEAKNNLAQRKLKIFLAAHWDRLVEQVIQHFCRELPGSEALIRERIKARAAFIHFKITDFLALVDLDDDVRRLSGTWSVADGEMMLSSVLFTRDLRKLEHVILHELSHAVSGVNLEVSVYDDENRLDGEMPRTHDELVEALYDTPLELGYDLGNGYPTWLVEAITEGEVVDMMQAEEPESFYPHERGLRAFLQSAPTVRRALPAAYLELHDDDSGFAGLHVACSQHFGENSLRLLDSVVAKHRPEGALTVVRGFHGKRADFARYLKGQL
jgi:hypothetical protein